MRKLWWETREYELKAGGWVPQVHLMELVPDGVEVSQLLAPTGVVCDSQEEAKAYSEAMARKWIRDNLL